MVANTKERNIERRRDGNKCKNFFRQNKILVLLICLIIFSVVVGILLIFVIPVLLKKEARPFRLPNDIVPYHYKLEIKPYLIQANNSEFEGQVEIYVECVRKTDVIVLHSRNLTIVEESVKVTNIDDGNELKVLLIDYDISNDLLLLWLLEDLKEREEYRIYIKYKGPLEQGYNGFFISTYEDNENSVHYAASTQFEPDRARKAFPCFDEPNFKSTFNITLVRFRRNMTSLSNMPKMRKEDRGEDWVADIYEKSMKMSTYLVAFFFGDYVYRTKDKITVWSPAHRKDNTEFALNVSVKALQFFEKKLGIPYPGPKLDMVPVMSLSRSGMENWGLLIFGVDTLLTPENKSADTEILSEIAITVAHEIAHQWFGNLVTPKWWSDIWLSEGITNYMTDLAMIELFPEWNRIDPSIMALYSMYPIEEDCSASSASLLLPVNNRGDVYRSFNKITYVKGGLIIRMAHRILHVDELDDNVFWNGIKRYLMSNAYENVEQADLWRYLTAAQLSSINRLDLAEIMYAWTHLSGVPIITVHRDYTRKTATIMQESCKSKMKEYENDLWNVPIIVETRYNMNLLEKLTWLKERKMVIESVPKDEWIFINGAAIGNYLVNYDRENWNRLSNQLRSNHGIFDPTERFKFITDIDILERLGSTDIDLVFQLSLYLAKETELGVFKNGVTTIIHYMEFFDRNKYYDLLREFLIHIGKDMYDRLSWKEKSNITSIGYLEAETSVLIAKILCGLRYAPCVKQAIAYYATTEKRKVDIDDYYEHSYRMIALCTVVRNATYEEWKNIKENFFSEVDNSEVFISECSNDATIIREELYAILKASRPFPFWLKVALTRDTVFFNVALNFFDEHFKTLMESGFVFPEWRRRWISDSGINVWKIEKMIQMLRKHLKDLSGETAKDFESFLKFLKELIPIMEKKKRILKRWLERKPWL